MANRGYFKRQATSTEQYSEGQIKAIIQSIGIELVSQTQNDFLCLCPIHGNKNTPSLSISKGTGLFLCFNPACGESGSLVELVKLTTKRNDFEALRLISKAMTEALENFDEQLEELLEEKNEYTEFPADRQKDLLDNMQNYSDGREYMHGRGFNDDTINYFGIGYSVNLSMVTVPVHSPDGLLVGVIGRSVKDKRFKNSNGLPTNRTLFNIHRARRESSTVIITEASFDAMRIHQAGFPNVVATMGGHISPVTLNLLNRNFTKIIIATDFDDKHTHGGKNPGRELGLSIIRKLKNKDVYWAAYDYKVVYPHGAKDIGDLTDEEIKKCIKNAVPHYEYHSWNLY
jgi:DNA primase